MALSYSENTNLTCPSCGARFDAEVWMLVDAAERPDLAHALREGTLNIVVCPRCDHRSPAGAALLFHDPVQRRVYFAAPAGAAEHELREQAQSLLYLLVDNLPEEARRPYLGDVQVEQELEGVRRAVLRRAGRRSRAPGAGPVQDLDPAPRAHGAEHHVVEAAPPQPPQEEPPIFEAVRALLAADTAEEFAAIVDAHPALLEPAGDAALVQLAEVAFDQGERDIATALQGVRATLADLREARAGERAPGSAAMPVADPAAPAQAAISLPLLSGPAYQALLRAGSPDELLAAIHDYPSLLEPWVDPDLAARADAALDEGNERLAGVIEERRETLAELRAELSAHSLMIQAIETLLQARDEDDVTSVLAAYPVLLTDAAQEALFHRAATARAQGDRRLAEYAVECGAMLRTIRSGLEEG